MITNEWQTEIGRVAAALSDAGAESFASLAADLHRSLCSAPPEVVAAIGMPCRADRLRRLIEVGALREAAFELLGRAQYMMSRSGEGHVLATVYVPDLFPETRCSSDHEAAALAAALAEGLRDWGQAAISLSPSRAAH